MPHKHHLFSRSNRSQVSLGIQETNEEQSYSDSPLHSPAFPPQSAPSPRYDDREENQSYGLPYRSEEARFYLIGSPQRSQSQRVPSLINTNQPTIHLVAPHNNSASTPSSAIEDNPDKYYQQGPPPPAHKAEPKKRRFFGLGNSSSAKESGKGTGAPAQKLGRSISVRRKEQIDPQTYADAGVRTTQHQRWSTSEPPAEEEDEDDGGGAGLRTTHPYYSASSPQPPDKDPLKSPAFPPPVTHEEYIQGRTSQQGGTTNPSSRYPLERQGSHQLSWEKTAQQAQKHSRSESQQTPSSYHPSPSSATSTSSHTFAHRAPHEPLYQDPNNRPPSQQSLEPPAPAHHPRASEPYQSRQGQNQDPSYAQGSMGPPPTQQPPPNRRSSESTQQSQSSQGREGGVYQPYSQSVQQGAILPSNAPPQYSAQLAPQGQNYRSNTQPSSMAQQHSDQGRSTPPPSRSRDDLSGLEPGQLLARHDELRMPTFSFSLLM